MGPDFSHDPASLTLSVGVFDFYGKHVKNVNDVVAFQFDRINMINSCLVKK